MLARDIMTTPIELLNRRASLKDAAMKMASLDIGALPVVDRSTVIGMITDRDIVVRGIAAGLDPLTVAVDTVMTHGVIDCQEDEDVKQVAEIMERHALRRVLVLNQSGKPVGIISVEDLASRGIDKQLAAEALHRLANGKALIVPTT